MSRILWDMSRHGTKLRYTGRSSRFMAFHLTLQKESPDEVIHLASAMQFYGFRSVIGTMETKRITSTLVDDCGRLDHMYSCSVRTEQDDEICGYTIRSTDTLYPSRRLVLVALNVLAVCACYQKCYPLLRGSCEAHALHQMVTALVPSPEYSTRSRSRIHIRASRYPIIQWH